MRRFAWKWGPVVGVIFIGFAIIAVAYGGDEVLDVRPPDGMATGGATESEVQQHPRKAPPAEYQWRPLEGGYPRTQVLPYDPSVPGRTSC